MTFASSCKKEPQPIINNVVACNMADIDSTFIMVKQIDVDTINLFDEQGVFSNIDPNFYTTHFDATSYALVKCEGVILDTIPLIFYSSTNYEQSIDLQAPYFEHNYGVYLHDGKMVKYNRYKETTLEVYDNSGNEIGSCRFDGRGFYGTPIIGDGGYNNLKINITQDSFILGLIL